MTEKITQTSYVSGVYNRTNQELLLRYIICNYKWLRAQDGEPIRSQLACQPKTNCLLALTEGFYLHNSNPRANQSALTEITCLMFTSSITLRCERNELEQTCNWPLKLSHFDTNRLLSDKKLRRLHIFCRPFTGEPYKCLVIERVSKES